jgi:hypothetical protein
MEWFWNRLFIAAIFYVSIQYHFLGYILNFWFIPSYIVGIALGYFLIIYPIALIKSAIAGKTLEFTPIEFLTS